MIAGALAALVSGCGGGDKSAASDTSTPSAAPSVVVDRSTWSEQLDTACSELEVDYADLATADLADRDDAIAHAARVSDYADDLEGILDEAGVPSRDRPTAAELSDRAGDLAEAADELVAAARRGDVERTRQATRRLTAAGREINPLAERLDAPSCSGF
jgi:hypothetical protein